MYWYLDELVDIGLDIGFCNLELLVFSVWLTALL